MAALMLVFLAVGFARTLFLRSYFGTIDPASGTPYLPWHVYLHGSVMTAWCVVLFAQTSLVAEARSLGHGDRARSSIRLRRDVHDHCAEPHRAGCAERVLLASHHEMQVAACDP
jgi:hypothetical protein